MEFFQLVKERYSCRMLTDKPVEQQKIDKIIECANLAPTGVDKQPFKLWLMQSAEAVENIKKVTTHIPLLVLTVRHDKNCNDLRNRAKHRYQNQPKNTTLLRPNVVIKCV